ncbi:hypothetical protein [Zoogloea sp.]|uniref:hypothetical protein n=1 Tax=Zoogloea sp. TaxID=49181 RepID=UPI0035B3C72C
MNKFATSGLLLMLAGVVAGCTPRYADVPAPTRFENSTQQKIQAAQHWQKIAEHMAIQIGSDLQGKLNGRALFIPLQEGEQAFVSGFRELLITSLVQQGVPVSTDKRNALTVDVRYSIYKFNPERSANTYKYGQITALTAGLWSAGGIIGAIVDSSSSAGATAAASVLAVGAAETLGWALNEAGEAGKHAPGSVPRSEIVLTLSISDQSQIIARRTQIYYATDTDQDLYWKRSTSNGYTLPVVGSSCSEGGGSCAR